MLHNDISDEDNVSRIVVATCTFGIFFLLFHIFVSNKLASSCAVWFPGQPLFGTFSIFFSSHACLTFCVSLLFFPSKNLFHAWLYVHMTMLSNIYTSRIFIVDLIQRTFLAEFLTWSQKFLKNCIFIKAK